MTGKLMNKKQFAERAGMSVRSLERQMQRGLVEHTRPSPGLVRFTEEQYQKFVANRAALSRPLRSGREIKIVKGD